MHHAEFVGLAKRTFDTVLQPLYGKDPRDKVRLPLLLLN